MGGRESGKVRSRGKPGTFDDKTFRSFPKSPLQEAANPAQTGSEIRHGYAGSKITVRRLHHLRVLFLVLMVGQAHASAKFFAEKLKEATKGIDQTFFGESWRLTRARGMSKEYLKQNTRPYGYKDAPSYWTASRLWLLGEVRNTWLEEGKTCYHCQTDSRASTMQATPARQVFIPSGGGITVVFLCTKCTTLCRNGIHSKAKRKLQRSSTHQAPTSDYQKSRGGSPVRKRARSDFDFLGNGIQADQQGTVPDPTWNLTREKLKRGRSRTPPTQSRPFKKPRHRSRSTGGSKKRNRSGRSRSRSSPSPRPPTKQQRVEAENLSKSLS